MSFSISGVSSTHTYKGNSEVNFFCDEGNALTVTIDTERLHLRSVLATEEDCSSYAALFGDPKVMCKYATGQTKTKAEMETRLKDIWVKRWNQNDPYSALAVFKNDTDEFIGHVVLGYGDKPGQSELAYLFMQAHWNNKYATEAVNAVVKEYAPATVEEKYTLEGESLNEITATVKHDNPHSEQILIRLGMHKTLEAEKFEDIRRHYSIAMSELLIKA